MGPVPRDVLDEYMELINRCVYKRAGQGHVERVLAEVLPVGPVPRDVLIGYMELINRCVRWGAVQGNTQSMEDGGWGRGWEGGGWHVHVEGLVVGPVRQLSWNVRNGCWLRVRLEAAPGRALWGAWVGAALISLLARRQPH